MNAIINLRGEYWAEIILHERLEVTFITFTKQCILFQTFDGLLQILSQLTEFQAESI